MTKIILQPDISHDEMNYHALDPMEFKENFSVSYDFIEFLERYASKNQFTNNYFHLSTVVFYEKTISNYSIKYFPENTTEFVTGMFRGFNPLFPIPNEFEEYVFLIKFENLVKVVNFVTKINTNKLLDLIPTDYFSSVEKAKQMLLKQGSSLPRFPKTKIEQKRVFLEKLFEFLEFLQFNVEKKRIIICQQQYSTVLE